LLELRHIAGDDAKDPDEIMRVALRFAHDDNENFRSSSLKILDVLAPDMGQVICQSFISPEIRSLGSDDSAVVRMSVSRNLLGISRIVSVDFFTSSIFPLYSQLTNDKDERVRKACAEFVSDISEVSPVKEVGKQLEDIYFRFLKDPTSKLVRGTAF